MYVLRRVAAAVVAILFFGNFAASAADLELSSETVATDAGDSQAESLWVAVSPAGDQPFTFWAAGQNGAGIDWALPDGAVLGETLWPQLHLLDSGGRTTLAFAGDAVILQQIELLPAGAGSQVGVTMSYAICAPDTGFCAAAQASGQLDNLSGSTGADLIATAREAAAPFRKSGIRMQAGEGQFIMGVNKNAYDDGMVTRAFFLPFADGLLAGEGALELDHFETGFFSTVEGGALTRDGAANPGKIGGLLVLQKPGADGVETYLLKEPNDYAQSRLTEEPVAYDDGLTLLPAILFALLGGMILNLMPCVFPILAMKVFALVRAGSESQQALRTDALVYTAGVVVSFLTLAGVLIFIRSLGNQVGWGFQLQSPAFIFIVTIVLFLVGLNLLGVFQFGGALQNLGGRLAARVGHEGKAGAFFTGVLATVVATPCTAPFMAPAIGYALTQSAVAGLAIFAALGLGLALPFLVISYVPAIQRRFPAPGPWMVRFKEFLAFPMFATIVWLVWILETQSGTLGMILVLGALVLTGLGVWLANQLKGARGTLRHGAAAAMMALVLAPAFVPNALPQIIRSGVQTQFSPDIGIHSEVYSEARLDDLRAAGRPVFLHFWASWCITCLMHENLVFSTDEFQNFLKDNDMVFMEIDNTIKKPGNVMLMESFGRSGQPLDIFFPGDAGAPALVLPELFTTSKVLGIMEPQL